jgi:hypothetical protein
MQPSASRSSLLAQCSKPFDPDLVFPRDVPGEPAKWGSAWHEVAAWVISSPSRKLPTVTKLSALTLKAARHYDVEGAADELTNHLLANLPEVLRHIAANAPKVLQTESSIAYNPVTDKARLIPLPTEDEHRYMTVAKEIGMTYDWAYETSKFVEIGDHKTGMSGPGQKDFSRPAKLDQLLTLALGYRSLRKIKKPIRLAVNHAFRRGMAKVYWEEVNEKTLQQHREKLVFGMNRIGDGTMRPGPCCEDCPARIVCVAGDSSLLDKAEGLLRGSNVLSSSLVLTSNDQTSLTREQRLGNLHEVIASAMEVAERAKAMIKEEVRAGILPELSDGRRLVLKTRNVERLSKTAFVDTYGKLQAERMFQKFRSDGALVKKAEEYLTKDD